MTDIKNNDAIKEEKGTDVVVSPLFAEWGKDKSQLAKEQIENNFKMLRSDAENYLGQLNSALFDAKSKYADAKLDAKETKKFAGIAEANKNLMIAQKTLDAALKCYIKEFGQQPAIMK